MSIVMVAGCGGGGSQPVSGPPSTASTFKRLQTQVFNVSCSADSCHSSAGRAGDLILQEGYAWDSLINQAPSNQAASAHGWMRVMPGQPERSFLMAKLAGNLAAGEGTSMPWGAAPLDTSTVDIVHAWIAAGAPLDGIVPGDDGRDLGGGGTEPGDISLPPPAQGVQLKTTSPPVPQGRDETGCHYLKLPSDVDLDVSRLQVAVSGGSHHIHLYRAYDAALDLPDHYEVCNYAVDFDVWELVLAVQVRRTDWELPTGVAFHFRAGEQLLIQTHFVNVGSLETAGEGKAIMNLQAAEPGTTTAHAGGIFGLNRDVFVPAHSKPTATAECVFPNDIALIAQTGHYHFRGRRFRTYRWDDGMPGALLYEHLGYDDPTFQVYDPPLDFAAGQGVQWECYWENPTDKDFPFGPFTEINEHCNWFGFYYPTSTPDEAITCVKENGVSSTTVRHAQ